MIVKSRIRDPHVRRFTVKEYYRLAELGLFRDERVELIEGVIVKMLPMNAPHANGILKSGEAARVAFGPGHVVRQQLPLLLGKHSEPQPDIAVVEGKIDDYPQHPTTALLVVEISDSTLWYDRRRKGGLYARAGIADYWILNLRKRQLEVYRNPIADSTQYAGHRYGVVTILTEKDEVYPLAAPTSRILVADLLP